MAFDQKDFVWIAFDHAPHRRRNAFEKRHLIRQHFPRAALECDCVELDFAHTGAQIVVVADFVERIAPRDALERWRFQNLHHLVWGSLLHPHDVLLARDRDAWRRQIDDEPGGTRRPGPHNILHQHEFAAIGGAADTADEASVRTLDRDDLNAIRSCIDHPCLTTARAWLHLHLCTQAAETFPFIVANDDAVVLADDLATVRFFDDGASAFDALASLTLHLLDAALIDHAGTSIPSRRLFATCSGWCTGLRSRALRGRLGLCGRRCLYRLLRLSARG